MPRLEIMTDAATIIPMPVHVAHRDNMRRRHIPQGRRIFGESKQLKGTYLIAKGEAMIIKDGYIVDFVERGEVLDSRIWSDATAVAYTDCLLEPQSRAA